MENWTDAVAASGQKIHAGDSPFKAVPGTHFAGTDIDGILIGTIVETRHSRWFVVQMSAGSTFGPFAVRKCALHLRLNRKASGGVNLILNGVAARLDPDHLTILRPTDHFAIKNTGTAACEISLVEVKGQA